MSQVECIWAENEDSVWDTGCGGKYVIMEGDPKDNRMNYCTYCGGRIKQMKSIEGEPIIRGIYDEHGMLVGTISYPERK